MSFTTRNLGIEMNQGDDFGVILTLSDINGPIDITGYEFFGEMKLDTDPETGITAEFVFAILNQTSNKGQVQVSLPNATTAALSASVSNAEKKQRLTTPYVFDWKMKDTSNLISRIVEGIIYLSPQVTQETS